MGARPLIAVTTSITVGTFPERAYVNSTYLRAVQEAGGVPVMLPPQLSADALFALGERMQGLLLTGGGDVDPARYGETPHPTLYDVAAARDTLEIAALRLALDRSLPVLAICRGIQVLNVAMGGSLYQDVATDPGTEICHSQKEPRHEPTHKVTVVPGSRLAEVMGTETVEVNSMHHQTIKGLGRDLVAVAWAPDTLIEGVESADPQRFILGVQWHPEELVPHSEPARRLFTALVRAAAR